MLFTTPTQFLALAVALIAGWFFGLASHPGGRKWRDRHTAEREAHAATRAENEQRMADTNARLREIEAENARLGRAAPFTAATIAPHAHAATENRPELDTDHIGTNG